MKIRNLTQYLESIAPLNYQEPYDNAGLLVGDPEKEITQALISLDCTEEIVDEAIAKRCDIVISHHPIVFKGLKKFNNKDYVERTVIKAIKNDIALYAIHTNLDNVKGGVNFKLAEKIGLVHSKILKEKAETLQKLTVYVPKADAEKVRQAMFDAGAGNIGEYDECSYNTEGKGTFRPSEAANPTIGTKNKLEWVEETKIEVTYASPQRSSIIKAMHAAHPYEEVAYNVVNLQNSNHEIGSGIIGELPNNMNAENFLDLLKKNLDLKVIRHSPLLNKDVKKVAVCGGAGSFLLEDAIRQGADVFVTSDFKYHEFFDAEGKIIITDIGHFESEQFTQDLLMEIIQKKFTNFAVQKTEIDTNPIQYYY
ncbi:MAG TPA: Nif3-like dinuclear metal center hexameric protein [Sphingobacterium sp.]|nr:Nif3-like dinuclear metal center hexameric protein [Sphingobacterium sp.]